MNSDFDSLLQDSDSKPEDKTNASGDSASDLADKLIANDGKELGENPGKKEEKEEKKEKKEEKEEKKKVVAKKKTKNEKDEEVEEDVELDDEYELEYSEGKRAKLADMRKYYSEKESHEKRGKEYEEADERIAEYRHFYDEMKGSLSEFDKNPNNALYALSRFTGVKPSEFKKAFMDSIATELINLAQEAEQYDDPKVKQMLYDNYMTKKSLELDQGFDKYSQDQGEKFKQSRTVTKFTRQLAEKFGQDGAKKYLQDAFAELQEEGIQSPTHDMVEKRVQKVIATERAYQNAIAITKSVDKDMLDNLEIMGKFMDKIVAGAFDTREEATEWIKKQSKSFKKEQEEAAKSDKLGKKKPSFEKEENNFDELGWFK